MRDTAKILINIASTEYMRDEAVESLRYYKHALSVLKNCKEYPTGELSAMHKLPKGSFEAGASTQYDFELNPE